MLELMLYGALCSLSALCGIPAMMYRDDDDGVYALVGGMVMSLFWCANATLWMNNGVEFFAFVDGCFLAATAVLWWFTRLRWVGLLAILFAGNLFLDFLFLRASLPYLWFARSSNVLFVAELATVGWVGWSVLSRLWKSVLLGVSAMMVVLLGLLSFGIV